MNTLTHAALALAKKEIADNDAVMAALIARLPPPKLVRRQSPFQVLATSVINQQLSQKAAATIEARVAALTSSPFCAAEIAALPPAQLRQAGLSANKSAYLQSLATASEQGLLNRQTLDKLSDDAIIAQLTAMRGIGKWTAEMFLMFCLHRRDVLPLNDAGLLRAARQLYGKRYRGDDATVLTKAAKHWQPWCTVACYYLWRSLDK